MKWLLYIGASAALLITVILIIGATLPEAHVASRTTQFQSPPQKIWDTVANPSGWYNQKDKVTVVESVPPRRLVTRIADPNLPYDGSWTYEIAPATGGSVLTITENGQVHNLLFRFVSRFIMGHTATIDAYLRALRAKLGESP